MTLKNRLLAIALAVLTILCMTTANASAAWKTCNFNNSHNSGYTTVKLVNTKKDGKVKIHTYNCVKGNHSGKCFGSGETKAKLKATFRTTGGAWICQFNTTSKSTLKLGKDHSAYKIQLTVRQDLGANNFTNLGKCAHWAIETSTNTKF